MNYGTPAPSNPIHGARTPRVYGRVAKALAADLVADRPDLRAYPEAVAGWASAEAQAALLRRHIDDVGPIDPESGEPRKGVLDHLRLAEAAAVKHRATLGLDPRSEASLARERAQAASYSTVVDLAALAEAGQAALDASVLSRARPSLPAAAADDYGGAALAQVADEDAARTETRHLEARLKPMARRARLAAEAGEVSRAEREAKRDHHDNDNDSRQ